MADTHRPAPTVTPLTRVAKGTFPFSLGCPSFIYRAGYAENVRLLAPYVDEIQLLFFESRTADSLPSPAQIRELSRLGLDGDVRFSVHLPTDIDLGDRDATERRRAVTVLRALITRCEPLMPSTFTLHLACRHDETDIARWQHDAAASLERVLAAGMAPRRLSVENLDDDFDRAAPLVEMLDLSVCLDMGHLMAHGRPIRPFFDRWQQRIGVVHLHGVEGTRDHLPLDRLAPDRLAEIRELLRRFTGSVVVEVYAAAALDTSLHCLANAWQS